jgi:hypothetical protein
MSKVHAGLWADCKNCNADWKPKKKDRREKKVPVNFTGDITLDVSVRRQVAADLGDVEPTKEQKFALLQKYGVVAARIDRKITKPFWNTEEEKVWNNRVSQFEKVTRGLVPPQQVRRACPSGSSQTAKGSFRQNRQSSPTVRNWQEIRFKDPQAQTRHEQRYHGPKDSNSSRSSRPSHRNSNPTRTATPQS